MSACILVVDDEPDVEALFRQQFRRELRAKRFVMEFANSAADALARVTGLTEQSPILIFSDINMPGMTGLEMLPKEGAASRDTRHHDHGLRRSRNSTQGYRTGRGGPVSKPIDFAVLRSEIVSRLEGQTR